jgi:hypothetical protein
MNSLKKKPKAKTYEQWKKNNLWRKKEKSDAKVFGGQRTPRSGGLWNKPGDVKTIDWLFDCKQTTKLSYSINTRVLKKIYREAILSNRTPALSVILGDGTEFVVLQKNDFLILTK